MLRRLRSKSVGLSELDSFSKLQEVEYRLKSCFRIYNTFYYISAVRGQHECDEGESESVSASADTDSLSH